MKKNKLALIIVIVLTVSSCTVKYFPIPDKEASVTEDFGVIREDDLVFAAANRYWVKEPQNLTEFYTTFYVSIENRSSEKIDLGFDDIVLLDSSGNQFDAVSLDYVMEMIVPSEVNFNSLIEIQEEDRYVLEKWRDGKNNLMQYSFHFGVLLPKAKKSGFVFFPKLDSQNQQCKIIFRNKEINFKREN